MAGLLDHPAHHPGRSTAVRRWSGIALVGAILGSALSTGALAVVVGPVRLGSTALRRPAVAPEGTEVHRAPWRSAGTVRHLHGPVVASTGPSPARAELRTAPRPASGRVARDIARHLALGNTEVARYVIPYEIYRTSGCRLDFVSTTMDPSQKEAVKAERKARSVRLERARDTLGREAVAHAAESTDVGLKLHVIVAQLCPVRRGT